MRKKERFKEIIKWFQENMPTAETELIYENPYQLLIAVILSAQCTDKRINIITPPLFKQYPNAESLSKASQDEIFQLIKSCSYPNNKAKHLVGMSHLLHNEFNGIVPESLTDLQKLPGVGRKTANVISSIIFNKPNMAVDTHVFRVSARIGLTTNAKTPLETEKQLIKYFPEELIAKAHHWLILHGRYICMARKPKCDKCGINTYCKYFSKLKTS